MFASWGWLCHVPDYLNLLICPEATRRAAILGEPTGFLISIAAVFFQARSPRWPRACPPQASSEGSGLERSLVAKSFSCHRSAKSPAKSNHCHTSKNLLPQVLYLPHLRTPPLCLPASRGKPARRGWPLREQSRDTWLYGLHLRRFGAKEHLSSTHTLLTLRSQSSPCPLCSRPLRSLCSFRSSGLWSSVYSSKFRIR